MLEQLPPGMGRILRLSAIKFRGKILQRRKYVDVRITAAKQLNQLFSQGSIIVRHISIGCRNSPLGNLGFHRNLALASREEVTDATDLRSNAAQLLFNPFVSAVDMVNAV